jgi:hypothetical protein
MTKFKVFGAVCLAAALATASPVLARNMRGAPGMHSAAHFAGGGWRGGGFRRGSFGPGIAAGVIAGAAIGSAYAYGPGYYGDSYAYDNGYDSNAYYEAAPFGVYNNNSYYNNNPNGFVCQPGTVFKGEDGRPHLCQ